MTEIRRVMMPAGVVLIAFHIGDETLHVEDLWGASVSLDFRFHTPDDVVEALRAASFAVTEVVERDFYEEAEYPDRRTVAPPCLPAQFPYPLRRMPR